MAVEFSKQLSNPKDVESMRSSLRRIATFLKVPVPALIQEMRLENSPLAVMANEDDRSPRNTAA